MVTPPSPTPRSRHTNGGDGVTESVQPKPPAPSYKPRSLLLVEKHMSMSASTERVSEGQPTCYNAEAVAREDARATADVASEPKPAAAGKSTKGYKPRTVAQSVRPQEGSTASTAQASLLPAKKAVRRRNIQVYSDSNAGTTSSSSSSNGLFKQPSSSAMMVLQDSSVVNKLRPNSNTFLPGKKLSIRRKDAFSAAQRKLEGIGAPGEQTDRGSGSGSCSDELESPLEGGKVLEAGGLNEFVE